MSVCICEFESECNGLGTLQCRGCGGDLCVCTCGGETECPGCEWCSEQGDDFEFDTDHPQFDEER